MKIGKHDLQKDGIFIIAELSANHAGDIEYAKKSIKAAKDAGANAVKLQTYTPDTLTLDSDNPDFVISSDTIWDGRKLYELYQEAYTPWEWHKELFEYARFIGIDIFSTPFDKSAVDFLETFKPSCYKIASFEIVDYELVRYIASKGRPLIISTGIATKEEISQIVQICHQMGNEDIVLLKCTSAYPAPKELTNLATMVDMKKFGTLVGFSDHTMGIKAPLMALGMGAKVIEKHFILDANTKSADASFSLSIEELKELCEALRDAQKLIGEVRYNDELEGIKGREFGRSIYTCKEIKKGELITCQNTKSVRPSTGLHPKYLPLALGKKSKKDLKAAQRLRLEDIEVTKNEINEYEKNLIFNFLDKSSED